ncbi:response regulator transcription factor [Aromatoleum petrolei]|uniref:Response regulator n=1 Tax=Aromatoleum petrolei TaxID=76116 RepID=A0ABX1MQ61_9RHOO|nr:response regulator transcription factor [Aromatoleum petrolei]NMF90079.1 response regulator [Aromatoleum petrolei]QTQ36182.1 Putative two component system response regulator [Aromatoleum petrolei]
MIEVTERPIRVFLVDDHRATLWGLERLVDGAQRMQLAGSATSVAELLASPESREADVIVIDLDLGGHDSSDSFAELLSTYGAKVLVLTGARDLDAHRRAVMAGARGVVRKEEPVDVLLRAIEKVHEGDVWVNRALIGDIMNMLTGNKRAAAPDDARIASLTPKEHEVIGAVVRHKGAKSLVIADDLGISEHTLRNHLTAIYHKLEVHGRLELYLYAKERGIGTVAQ